MYKIFTNNKPVIIAGNPSKNDLERDGLFLRTNNVEEVNVSIEAFENQIDLSSLYIATDDPQEIWNYILSKYTKIEAAGGLVKKGNTFLFIYRNGYWDLPKGKIENNEEPNEAAIREVEEECGLSDLQIIKPLQPSYHTYNEKGKKIIKKTHWFLMNYNGFEEPTPQKEEGITKAKWNKCDREIFNNTFNSIKEVLNSEL